MTIPSLSRIGHRQALKPATEPIYTPFAMPRNQPKILFGVFYEPLTAKFLAYFHQMFLSVRFSSTDSIELLG